ncbi:MAG: INTEIN-C-TER domain-containing protein [Succiniclasticum sp.]
MKSLSLDLETYSDVNLAKCGVYKYAESPAFEILLFGYAVDGGPVQVIDLAQGETIPEEILDVLTDDTVTKWAFNANFERVCLSRYLTDLGRSLDPFHDQHPLSKKCARFLNPAGWKCSMVWSAYLGLPLSLEGVGAVLNLDNQKMKEGRELIRYFCIPCKETKANGGRTRNLPQHAPEKWNLFKSYNKRDVEVEMAIQQRLQKYPVPEKVWEEYHLDQEINDRGIAIDLELARQAVALDAQSRKSLMAALKERTGLENPNSVLQMLDWLEQHGMKTDSLGKKNVQELLKTAQEPLRSVLLLRQKLAKSSVKKYQAMEMTACKDGRARGMFQFYGANRTGRFAGRHIQLQNLPQNHMSDLAEARELVRQGNYEALDLLYDSIPDVLSQLIRTAFIPRQGMKFMVSDFSAIEARVISWMAGEKWKSAAFAAGKDIYCSTASQMFGVPVVKHGINGELRQKGKIAELACIAEGQMVLTDHGLIPIEKVTTDDRVWDGNQWVHHDGVVYRGEREVMTYEGLTATADHLVWVQGKQEPVQFGIAASSGAHLLQTGNGRKAIRLGQNHQSGKKMEQELESLLCIDTMSGLRIHPMDSVRCSDKRQKQGMSALFASKKNTSVALQTVDGSQTTLRKSQGFWVFELWSPGNPIHVSKCACSRVIFAGAFRCPRQGIRNRPNQQQWRLCSGKPPYGPIEGESRQSPINGTVGIPAEILAVFLYDCNTETDTGRKQGENHRGCSRSGQGKTKKLVYHKRTARLYDIRNAGPYHRFTVSGCLVHNCGYGGSVGALKAMGALDMGIPEEELGSLVQSWRSANPHIVDFWWQVDGAVKTTIKQKIPVWVNNIRFSCQSGMLFIELPSGRRLSYVKPRIGENKFGGESVTYEGIGATKKWERLESYGPKFVENIVQGTARDILCYAMQTLRHCAIVGHVHDELIIECSKDVSVDAICQQMSRTPPWAKGLVLRADGYECEFYQKD